MNLQTDSISITEKNDKYFYLFLVLRENPLDLGLAGGAYLYRQLNQTK
jgi:hypothetical protein